MEEDLTACSNCKCPLNYDCIRFEIFYYGKYKDISEFTFNQDYSCDEMVKKEEAKSTNTNVKYSLF